MDDFKDVLKVCGFCFIGAMTLFSTFLLILWVVAGFEYSTWNRLHGTNYTHYEWFTGSDFIEKYHYPGREEAVKNEIKLIQD